MDFPRIAAFVGTVGGVGTTRVCLDIGAAFAAADRDALCLRVGQFERRASQVGRGLFGVGIEVAEGFESAARVLYAPGTPPARPPAQTPSRTSGARPARAPLSRPGRGLRPRTRAERP